MIFFPREKPILWKNSFKAVLNAFVFKKMPKQQNKKVVKQPTLLLGKLGENKE